MHSRNAVTLQRRTSSRSGKCANVVTRITLAVEAMSLCTSRKEAAEADRTNDLCFIKEDLLLRHLSTGTVVASGAVRSSEDGALDVWDGRLVTLFLSDDRVDLSMLADDGYEFVLKRTTLRFSSGVERQEWRAPLVAGT